jgi:hypothetical protein
VDVARPPPACLVAEGLAAALGSDPQADMEMQIDDAISKDWNPRSNLMNAPTESHD